MTVDDLPAVQERPLHGLLVVEPFVEPAGAEVLHADRKTDTEKAPLFDRRFGRPHEFTPDAVPTTAGVDEHVLQGRTVGEGPDNRFFGGPTPVDEYMADQKVAEPDDKVGHHSIVLKGETRGMLMDRSSREGKGVPHGSKLLLLERADRDGFRMHVRYLVASCHLSVTAAIIVFRIPVSPVLPVGYSLVIVVPMEREQTPGA